MDWYDTDGDGWLETVFGDVNADGYFDTAPADAGLDPCFDTLAVDGIDTIDPDLSADVVDSLAVDETIWHSDDLTDPWPAGEHVTLSRPDIDADFASAGSAPAGSSIWSLDRPW